MEPYLEILREVQKGIMRQLSAYFFRKNVLENKKTTPRRSKQKGGSQNELTRTTTTLTVEVAGEKC